MKKLFLILMFSFFSFFVPREALAAHKESVVCLHGFLLSYKEMLPIGRLYKKLGKEVYLWGYESRKALIEEHAYKLVQFLHILVEEKPKTPIHFVTHSLGGLVLRAALSRPDCPYEATIGKAILLAPPNQGSSLGRCFQKAPLIRWIFGNKAGQQLLTYDAEAMAKLGTFPPSKEIIIISGYKSTLLSRFIFKKQLNDGKVTIKETCLSSPHKHYLLYVAHHWISVSRQTLAILASLENNDNSEKL